MKVIVGLGNPGKQYEQTRHNAGFMVLEGVAKEINIDIRNVKFSALVGEGFYKGQKVILVKPQTFMNLSGDAVSQVMNYYDVDLEDLLVVSDDLDLPVGSLRVRRKGRSGGQKGIQSIIDRLGSSDFVRVKIGIGKNPLIPTVDYVLGKIEPDTAIQTGINCVMDYLNHDDVSLLMNTYNKKEEAV